MTGYTMTSVSHYLRKNGKRPIDKITKNELVWDDECLDMIMNRVIQLKHDRELAEIARLSKVETDKVEKEEDHPLVTDKRCLRMSYWPDTVPKGFEEY
jgi:hypothetical protein